MRRMVAERARGRKTPRPVTLIRGGKPGRPKRFAEGAVLLQIRVDPEIRDALRALATERGQDVAELVRRLIEAELIKTAKIASRRA